MPCDIIFYRLPSSLPLLRSVSSPTFYPFFARIRHDSDTNFTINRIRTIERHRNDRTCPLYECLIKRLSDVKLNVKLYDIDFITITIISKILTDNSKQNCGLILFGYLTNEIFPFCWNFRTQRYFDTSRFLQVKFLFSREMELE